MAMSKSTCISPEAHKTRITPRFYKEQTSTTSMFQQMFLGLTQTIVLYAKDLK